jgi:hypothetical protein
MKDSFWTRREFLSQTILTAGAMHLGAMPDLMEWRTSVDVLVYDSTPAGIMAGIAAARRGCSVLLVTEDRRVGGMRSSGLGVPNIGVVETTGGMAMEFYRRVHAHYLERYGPGSQQVQDSQEGFRFEPHVAQLVFERWLTEAGVPCWKEDWIESVEKDGTRIRSARFQSGRVVAARVFIDASYEGDLFKLAGCSYHVGRESVEQYGESLAGVKFPPRDRGKADAKVMGYDYRLCLTDVPANQVPFRKPTAYDPTLYELERLKMRTGEVQTLAQAMAANNMMPNRKTDTRSLKMIGGSWRFPEASVEERRVIARAHRDFAEGYIWFLLTHPSVPAPIRDELSRWGYPGDEFQDTDHFPFHVYVREARRLVGDFVMTQGEVERRFQPDAVAIGSYDFDVHTVQILTGLASDLWEGEVEFPQAPRTYSLIEEGGFRTRGHPQPYEIPYRVLLPRRSEAENLLVPLCMSSSHIGYSTMRMEPVYMMTGHAAGVAAALSLEHGAPVQQAPVAALQEILIAEGQILDARPFRRT